MTQLVLSTFISVLLISSHSLAQTNEKTQKTSDRLVEALTEGEKPSTAKPKKRASRKSTRTQEPTPTATPLPSPTPVSTPEPVPEVRVEPQSPNAPVVVEKREPPVEIETTTDGPSRLRPFSAGAMLALGLPVPFKYGLNAAYTFTPRLAVEASYLTGSLSVGIGSIDVGSFDESLLAVSGRFYPFSGSFNLIFGLAQHSYKVGLGSALVSRFTGPVETDILDVKTLDLQLGLGNQWRFYESFWLGIDWVTLSFPIATLQSRSPALEAYSSERDRQNVEDVLSILRKIPTATVLKTSIGWSF